MEKMPLVSIIIPTFNRAHLIGKTLNSVIAQIYTNWECIVVDDGSTNATLEVLKKYNEQDSRILFFKRERLPKGAPTCRNIGLKYAKGDYIIYLDSDDYLLPFCLEKRVKTFTQFPDNNFLVFPMGERKDNGIEKKEIPFYDDYLIPFLSANLPWTIMCPIWSRSFLIKLNGFTEGYPRFNDPELMIRALLQDNVQFKVFNDIDYDTVFVYSPKNYIQFKDKVFKSLRLFIPDIVKLLNDKSLKNNKTYLVFYLHFWFKYIYVPLGKSNVYQSILLIKMFNGQGVISSLKSISLILRLLLYEASNIVFKQPINKLSDRSLYINTQK